MKQFLCLVASVGAIVGLIAVASTAAQPQQSTTTCNVYYNSCTTTSGPGSGSGSGSGY